MVLLSLICTGVQSYKNQPTALATLILSEASEAIKFPNLTKTLFAFLRLPGILPALWVIVWNLETCYGSQNNQAHLSYV